MSGIPRRHCRWTVDSLGADTEHLDVVQRYVSSILERVASGLGLYLYGGVGSGKTTVACAIALSYLVAQTRLDVQTGKSSGQLVAFVHVPTLLDEIKQGYGDDDARARMVPVLASLASVPLAVFDDIGAERPSDWVRERLLTITNARYDSELCTIYTSNSTIPELNEPLGVRLASRITEMTVPIPFRGPDRRQKL